MLFTFPIVVPAGTPESNPKRETLTIKPGVITRIGVKFFAGVNNTVKVRILHGESPILPENKDSYVSGDNEEVFDTPYKEIFYRPAQLTFVGWSPAASYDHTVIVRILVVDPEIAYPYLLLLDELRRFEERMRVTPISTR